MWMCLSWTTIGSRKTQMEKVGRCLCWLTNRSSEYKKGTNTDVKLVLIRSLTTYIVLSWSKYRAIYLLFVHSVCLCLNTEVQPQESCQWLHCSGQPVHTTPIPQR